MSTFLNIFSYMYMNFAVSHVWAICIVLHVLILYELHFLGMLSKSRSQVLRLSPVLHILFNYATNGTIPDTITEEAAINFVEVSSEQTAIIAGRGSIDDILKKCKSGKK